MSESDGSGRQQQALITWGARKRGGCWNATRKKAIHIFYMEGGSGPEGSCCRLIASIHEKRGRKHDAGLLFSRKWLESRDSTLQLAPATCAAKDVRMGRTAGAGNDKRRSGEADSLIDYFPTLLPSSIDGFPRLRRE